VPPCRNAAFQSVDRLPVGRLLQGREISFVMVRSRCPRAHQVMAQKRPPLPPVPSGSS
jgi:hypothetical protein